MGERGRGTPLQALAVRSYGLGSTTLSLVARWTVVGLYSERPAQRWR